jgi:farnesyl diphosphate synthase
MHARKTGALIRAAAALGAIVVGADEDVAGAVDDYARELGLAFQIVDDVLDVEGSDAALGKTAGKDAAAGKPTYPALYGIEASRRLAIECVDRAKAAVAAAGLRGRLAAIADWSLTRRS